MAIVLYSSRTRNLLGELDLTLRRMQVTYTDKETENVLQLRSTMEPNFEEGAIHLRRIGYDTRGLCAALFHGIEAHNQSKLTLASLHMPYTASQRLGIITL